MAPNATSTSASTNTLPTGRNVVSNPGYYTWGDIGYNGIASMVNVVGAMVNVVTEASNYRQPVYPGIELRNPRTDIARAQEWLDANPSAVIGRPSGGPSISTPNYVPASDTTEISVTINRPWGQAAGDVTGALFSGQSTNPENNLNYAPTARRQVAVPVHTVDQDMKVDNTRANNIGAGSAMAARGVASVANELLNGMSQVQFIGKRTSNGCPYIIMVANPGLGNARTLWGNDASWALKKWFDRT